MQRRPLDRVKGVLQSSLLREGARMLALDASSQNSIENGDNSFEGKERTSNPEGELAIMDTQNVQQNPPSVSVPPAGGQADPGNQLFSALVRNATAEAAKGYGKRALEAAIPSAIYVAAVIVGYAGVVLITNKWGSKLGTSEQPFQVQFQGDSPAQM